jgi:hypothetical protein
MISVQEILEQDVKQLLNDVRTRWSSTFLMIDRILLLREVLLLFFTFLGN